MTVPIAVLSVEGTPVPEEVRTYLVGLLIIALASGAMYAAILVQ